ncbi:MAG TPA: NAD-dependent epimerase/dehydratase family protein [Dehalococcoidia bacterium]|nr:NAD-dependent epimerase/dehydratase family protein [Dehalococcoidia bacterium]
MTGVRALVTGGAGLVGSYITDQLLAAGASRVVVVDDFVRGRWENLDAAIAGGRVTVLQGDICDRELIFEATREVDLIFHQAALRITHCAEEPVRAIQVMVHGLQNVLDAARESRVQKILAASSASVYGEASYLPMDEIHPFNNRTLYGAAKIANEQLLRAYYEMYALDYVALRPFNVYGPRMDIYGVYTEVMIRWLERLSRGERPVIFGDGTQTMDFVHVEDVARAYLLAAVSPASDVVLNVGSGTETSLRALCGLLCEAMERPEIEPEFQAPRKVNPVSRRQASVSLAHERIGFETSIGLREGLRSLVHWFEGIAPGALAAVP